MIDVFLKGLGVGVAIAAPVGPIGLLCIRRSVAQGRAAGLATGFGAAAADGTYGLLVAAGISASGLLTRYSTQMQLFGGVLIACLGLLTLRGFFTARPAEISGPPATSILGAFGTTYLLTLLNPATVLAFAGMVAGLGAAASGASNAAYWLVIGVFLGSALWWLILVHAALWARARIAQDTLRWLDLIAGAVLTVWGIGLTWGAI
ncbi:homoserine/Threonine efflux protein [Thalassovita gelatinovora]|uniref:Homoserine/Threonine efflux protein n=1 Tax=Thalassovita gelatinovora TaxID=53501 RepID=A0A0P1FP74_THAGE|nr:LysE family transporter [Thalassovita gelatinovora]QIZ80155.1 LysE family transporter [Thalassovita gelatinovora]CUH63951.1 homoserine/Threonine efflux protein [Thalassovita gelatinovora]SEQ80546.1 Threonine/homoserine/homoserine lactone efflux protein [Thalassovita gelatinovora]